MKLGKFVLTPPLVAISVALCAALSSFGATRTWTGAGANAKASTAANWSDSTLPVTGDDIVFDSTSTKNVTWDAGMKDVVLASWTQTVDYTGTVTFQTTVASAFPQVEVSGDVVLNGGKWTLAQTASGKACTYRIAVVVGGALTIGPEAKIDVTGAGHGAGKCPTGQTHSGNAGTSHGGQGYTGTGGVSAVVPYDSIVAPLEPGSGGTSQGAGGGIVMLTVRGCLTNNGDILALGVNGANYPGSGGTINVTAGTISGAGRIAADAGVVTGVNYPGPSGGGRVAIRLTEANADFSDFSGPMTACGAPSYSNAEKTKPTRVGGAGTVWTSTAAQGMDNGTLLVDNGVTGFTSYQVTPIGSAFVPSGSFGDVVIGSCAKLQVAAGGTISISGDITSGSGQFVSAAGATVCFFGAGTSRVTGSAYSFVNLTAEAPGKTIVFDDGAVISASGVAALNGTAAENLTLRSATEGSAWTLTVPAGSTFTGVALRDCTSSNPITIVNGTDLGGNSANITFVNIQPGELITWTGAANTAWGNAANWDRGRTPIATDKVAVPAGAENQPVLAADATVAEIAVAANASLSLGGKVLTVTGDVTLSGEMIASGASVLRLGGDAEQALVADGVTLSALEIASPAVTISGDLKCASFTAGNGAAALDIAFAAGASLTANTMTVAGNPDEQTGFLRCATSGEQWVLNCNDAHVSDVTVSGSDASKGVTIAPTDCVDGGDNVNWLFVDNRTHWTGEASSDFADPANWSDGVPTATKDAVVEGSVPCVISSAAAAGNFTVNPDAQVTVNADFAVNGSLTILDGAVVTWNVPGTITGNLVLLSGATLTHSANSTTEANKLDLMIGGTGYIAEGANVTADAVGYANGNGPGALSGIQFGASYGGLGYYANTSRMGPCYGSILSPSNLGSGGAGSAGGGAIKLTFGGALTLDGTVSANGEATQHYTGSGGGICLTAASLVGTGLLRANGGPGAGAYAQGSGGRVAIHLTAATSLADFTGSVSVKGSCDTVDEPYFHSSSPGTYYYETAADGSGAGTILIDGSWVSDSNFVADKYRTSLTPSEPNVLGETANAKVTVKGKAYAEITRDTRIGDIAITDATGCLYLNGYTLQVHVRQHAISPNDAVQIIPGTRIDPETGETITGKIEWLKYGTVIIFK